MRVIDRLLEYLKHHNLTPYAFERVCGIANGYLKKQSRGKGTIGSEILEKIIEKYSDLSLTWLITGRGKMLRNASYKTGPDAGSWSEEQPAYSAPEQTIKSLRDKITILENALADKEKIIKLLEKSHEH